MKNPSIGAIQGWFQQEIEARKTVDDLQNGIHSYVDEDEVHTLF